MLRMAPFGIWVAAALAATVLVWADRLFGYDYHLAFLVPGVLLGFALVDGRARSSRAGASESSDGWFQRIVEAAPNAVIVVDAAGRIRLVNSQAEQLFGYNRLDVLGQSMDLLVPERYRAAHGGHRTGYMKAPSARSMGMGRDLYALRQDGTEVAVEIGLNTLATDEGSLVLASIIDITQRKIAEKQLRASLREKEVLLREIHHRVKNNLAVIASLFYLQSNATQDERARRVLADCRERVQSMALVHERLYQSEDLASIDFADYVGELSRQIHGQYAPADGSVRIEVDCRPLPLVVDQAIPCALILTELLTNAYKHAFPDGRNGVIRVQLASTVRGWSLVVRDNGVGIDRRTGSSPHRTLGFRLMDSLVGQLGAHFQCLDAEPGTEFRLHWKEGPCTQ